MKQPRRDCINVISFRIKQEQNRTAGQGNIGLGTKGIECEKTFMTKGRSVKGLGRKVTNLDILKIHSVCPKENEL